MTRRLTPHSTLENFRKEAKRWLKSVRAGDAEARARLRAAWPQAPPEPVLRDVQYALAREYEFENWTALKAALEKQPRPEPRAHKGDRFDQLARDMVTVYASDDAESMARINQHYSASYAPADIRALVWRLMYKVRQAKGAAEAFQLPEAQEMIARASGFPNWSAFIEAAEKGEPAPGPAFAVTAETTRIEPRRIPSDREWETILGEMKERRIARLHAPMMSDVVLRRIAELDFVTGLSLGGSPGLSDEGMQSLARMPQLEFLSLSEYPGGKISDGGLEVLRHLPKLRTFEMAWQKGITDAGVANLRDCEHLESVNLMGTSTGDGVIEGLRGKKKLRHFQSGRLVTDAGLRMLRDFPLFTMPHEGEIAYHLMAGAEDEPSSLLIDGPFTNQGLASLRELDGVRALALFWHVNNVSPDGLAFLAGMKNVRQLRCDGDLSNDTAMAHYATMPRLRFLSAQGNAATDAGFIALSRSATLEYFWGRECPQLTGAGFAALSKMPRLRGLGVSCKQVDNAALALLPHFPQLRELMPMDVVDDGFRYVGRCEKLQKLWCMYCRDTTDAATGHIAGLRLKTYYAGLTQITDRSLEILGQMASLEKIELYETKSITDAGIAQLAKLPRLREVSLGGLPRVTREGTSIFAAGVKVNCDV